MGLLYSFSRIWSLLMSDLCLSFSYNWDRDVIRMDLPMNYTSIITILDLYISLFGHGTEVQIITSRHKYRDTITETPRLNRRNQFTRPYLNYEVFLTYETLFDLRDETLYNLQDETLYKLRDETTCASEHI